MGKSSLRVVAGRVFGFVIFLILLGIANYLGNYVSNPIYGEVLNFFNQSILLLFIMMIFGLLAELFWNLMFPFNLIAPWFSALLGLLITQFIFLMLDAVSKYVFLGIYLPSVLISWLVFWTVVFVSYAIILVRLVKGKEEKPRPAKRIVRKRRK